MNSYTTTGGVKKAARYRYNFEIRRTPGSANDFTNVFSLIDAANSYNMPNYVANMESFADLDNWMRVFAANHAAGNWDSFGAVNAQNLYGYCGTLGTKYSLLMFDFNISIGNSGSWGPGENLFAVNGSDSNMQAIYKRMQTERQREAAEWRAEGEGASRRIRATADRQVTVIKADATGESERLRGDGDGERNRIYAEAYSQDPDFFAFYRSMKAYEIGLKSGETRLLLSPNSEFFRYFNSADGQGGSGQVPATPPESTPKSAPLPQSSEAAPAQAQ